MEKRHFLFAILLYVPVLLFAQLPSAADSNRLLILNQQIDSYVVQRNVARLENLYAKDFIFSHGSGRVDSKGSWLKSVAKSSFTLRMHDSVQVELHGGIALLRGKLSVSKKQGEEEDRYWLRYVRTYRKDSHRWQLISHITTAEYHLAR